MLTRYRLIELLADGQFRSGAWLGEQLGISRAAVWKQVRALTELGLEVHAVRGRGYRLAAPFQPLRSELLVSLLSEDVASRIDSIDVFHEIDSTSEHLRKQEAPNPGRGRVCLAEYQSAGRGRRGRSWVSPYGSSLYLSMAWHVQEPRTQISGLSLASAVAVVRALRQQGIEGLGLKWPNDIYCNGRKLAGILLDLAGEAGGNYQVVIGVGINLKIPRPAAARIDQPWADLAHYADTLDRNRLAAQVLNSLADTIDTFMEKGLEGFAQEWKRFDLVSGQAVRLQQGKTTISGTARGIDANGALLIERDGSTKSYHAGEVSVRLSG